MEQYEQRYLLIGVPGCHSFFPRSVCGSGAFNWSEDQDLGFVWDRMDNFRIDRCPLPRLGPTFETARSSNAPPPKISAGRRNPIMFA